MRSSSLLGTMFSNWVNICHTHNVMATATVMVIARNSLCILAFITTYATVDMMMQPHTHQSQYPEISFLVVCHR